MAGIAGRSGGWNRGQHTPLADVQLRGTFNPAKHLHRDPSEDDQAALRAAYQAFLDRLAHPPRLTGHPFNSYTQAVITGRIPAGRYHRLACARHQQDWARRGMRAFPYDVDRAALARFLAFVAELKHYKGQWAGQPIVLRPHQVFRMGSVMAWKHIKTGLRRFRRTYDELPRKNGKSLEKAVMALYITFFTGEGGAEGYCAATKKDQARIVWLDAAQLVKSSVLRARLQVYANSIFDESTSSSLKPLGADADSTDGLNPSCVVLDELHAHKNRRLIDVLETAQGARREPLDMRITTAGDNLVSPGGDEHTYACAILDGTVTDEQYFAFIAHSDEGDNWQHAPTWRKANPNYGVCVLPADLKTLAHKAVGIPAAAAAFQQKRLNTWINTASPCLSLDGWRKGQTTWTLEEMAHEPCWIGIDLAAKTDLCALVVMFPPTPTRASWRWYPYLWTPAQTVDDRAHRDRAPYRQWIRDGWLHATPGTAVNHAVIRETIRELRTKVDIERIGFDPYHADQIMIQLVNDDGFRPEQVLTVAQTYSQLTSAETQIVADVLAGHVDARGCPVTAWCAGHVVNVPDGKNNVQFHKRKSTGRIDPIKAGAIALSLFLREPARFTGYDMQVVG